MILEPEAKAELIERFIREMWPLNKSGNCDRASSEMIYAISKDVMFEGGVITLDILIEKYKEYLRYMKIINSDREPKYQTKIEPIEEFLSRKKYNEDFKPNTDSNLDLYLYGE